MRKPHRFRNGTVALRQIRKYQKSVNLQLAKSPFAKVVRDAALVVAAETEGMRAAARNAAAVVLIQQGQSAAAIPEDIVKLGTIGLTDGIRFTKEAMETLQEAAEAHITKHFRDLQCIATMRGKQTIMEADAACLRFMGLDPNREIRLSTDIVDADGTVVPVFFKKSKKSKKPKKRVRLAKATAVSD